MNIKKFTAFICAVLVLSVGFTGCSEKSKSSSEVDSSVQTESIADGNSASQLSASDDETDEYFSARDLDSSYDDVTAEISLLGTSASAKGDGVSVKDSTVTINAEGVYLVSGSLDDGQIIVNTDGKVQIVLNGADINCSTAPAIYVENSDKAFITLAQGSQNTVSDGSSYADTQDGSPDAAIYSCDTLTLNGTGSLTVNGNYSGGITSKDKLKLTGGTIAVNAKGNGIKGKDSVAVTTADITITSGNDGIKATNADDAALGFVYIKDGKLNITAEGDGIQAETLLTIEDGDINVSVNGGSANAAAHTNGMGGGNMGGGTPPGDMGSGNMGGGTPPAGFNGSSDTNSDTSTVDSANLSAVTLTTTEETDSETSTKGLKAGVNIVINGGNINVDCSDDAIHSNNTLTVSGGTLSLSAGSKGIHADSQLNITGGETTVSTSYEGLEATEINISGGKTDITASDDGLNASDGSAEGSAGNNVSTCVINVSGGELFVNADGDGIDSNGSMYFTGGTTLVNGPTNDGNGALDSNNEVVVNGGILIAAGSSGMAETPTTSSSQNCVAVTPTSSQSANTAITVCDADGNEIVTFAPSKDYASVIISTPEIKTGSTYKVYLGGSSTSDNTYGLYTKGGYKGDGTEEGSFTADSTLSTVGTASNAMGGNPGGGMTGGGPGGNMGGGRGQAPASQN